MERLYKIKSAIFGHAVADALGVPAEFRTRKELKKVPIEDMVGYGTYPYPAGCWSDDTSMTLCTLEAMSKGGLDLHAVMNNFVLWLNEDEFTPTGKMFDAGNICCEAIENYSEHNKPLSECGLKSERSNGNGSLMRIIPFALYGEFACRNEERLSVIHTGSALTHAHPRSLIGCGIYSVIISHLLRNADISSVYSGIKEAFEVYKDHSELACYEILRNLDSFKKLPESFIKSSGYVVDTLEAALWCLVNSDSYRACVLKAVNLGEDTDTVAAVAGGLAGLLYGYDAIPKQWVGHLKRSEYIDDICRHVNDAWER